MQEATTEAGWRALLAPRLMLTLCVLLGGVLLHSMNVLITATLFLPIGIQHCGDITRRWSRGIRNRGLPNDNGREAHLDLLVLFARRNEADEQDGA